MVTEVLLALKSVTKIVIHLLTPDEFKPRVRKSPFPVLLQDISRDRFNVDAAPSYVEVVYRYRVQRVQSEVDGKPEVRLAGRTSSI